MSFKDGGPRKAELWANAQSASTELNILDE